MHHVFDTHSNEPNFKFACNICSQTFTKYSSMTSHLYRKHRGQAHQSSVAATDDQEPPTSIAEIQHTLAEMDENSAEIDGSSAEVDAQSLQAERSLPCNSLQRSAALFLLTLKEKYKLTQTAVDFAVGQVQCMVNFALDDMRRRMELSSTFSLDPFEELHSEYMQTKFFKENFGLVVIKHNIIANNLIFMAGTHYCCARQFYWARTKRIFGRA